MRAYFTMEDIGRNTAQDWRALGVKLPRPWVARITGLCPKFGFVRQFVRAYISYERANSVGSRGIWLCYFLPEGLYQINQRYSWGRSDRYFAISSGGWLREIGEEEALECLRRDSESVCSMPPNSGSPGCSTNSLVCT